MLAVILLISIAVIAAIDFYPQFNTWQSRIKIGRWHDKKQWTQAIALTAKRWLRKTPVIKLTDNNRIIVWDMLRGNYARKAIQHWQEAALIMGLTDYYAVTGDAKCRQEIDRFLSNNFTPQGRWKKTPLHVDGAIVAYAVLRLPWIDTKFYKPAFDSMYALIQELTGADGTVAYRKNLPNYRYVDTIGFICPFLMRYGTEFNIPEATALACKQLISYSNHGMLYGSFLPCHTYNTETLLPAGLFGWGRGMGWFAIGLADTYLEMPKDHPEIESIRHLMAQFARTALTFQTRNGNWNWNVLNSHANPDSSATATIAYFLQVASSLPALQNEARHAVENASKYLMRVTRRTGAIDLSQGDTKDIGVYSQEFNILPFTQGFALRVACQTKA